MQKLSSTILSIGLITILLASIINGSVAPPILWTHTYQGEAKYGVATAYGIRSVVQLPNGGFALAGYVVEMILNAGEIDSDYWLLKTDLNGTQQYSQTYFGFGKLTSMAQTIDGGFLLAGDHSTLVKTNSAGAIQWNQTYNEGIVQSVIQTSDGGFAVAGYGTNLGRPDFWLAKTDDVGNIVRNQTYARQNMYDEAWALVQTSDYGYAIAGGAGTVGGGPGASGWLIKTDAAGNEQWNETYPGMIYSLTQTKDGGYILAGYVESIRGNSAMWLEKTGSDGSMFWNQTFGDNAVAWAVIQTYDGGYALAGTSLVKTDASGSIEWNQTITGQALSLIQTQNGDYAMAGGDSNADFYTGAWLTLTEASGTLGSPLVSATPSPTASPSPSQSPSPTPSPTIPELSYCTVAIISILATCAIIVSLKRKSKTPSTLLFENTSK